MLGMAAAQPTKAFAASAKAMVRVTAEGQAVDYFHGVPALYIPGLKNSNSGTYSCAGYVKSFYGEVYGIVPVNLFTGATPQDPSGKTTFELIETPRPGDIGNKSSHWFIVKEVNDDGTFTVIEQNWKWDDGNGTVCYINRKVSYATDSGLRFFRWSKGWELPEENTLSTDRMVSAGGHTYALFNDVLTWSDAKARCEALGGHLVTITSASEQNIVNLLTGKGMRPAYWIGLTDAAKEGTFRWVTGESLSYTNWNEGRPRINSSRNWVHLYTDNTWYDNANTDLSTAIGYLCEWEKAGYNGAPELLSITTQPANAVGGNGSTVTFRVKADGSGLAYQWQLSDDAGKTWRNSSTKTATYSTTLTDKNSGRYVRCIVTDKYGTQAISKSASMKLSDIAMTAQPASVTAKDGASVSFTVKATGEGLTYQWQLSDDQGKTWSNSKTTTATYTSTLTAAKSGRYVRCIVTDKYGAKVTSNAAYMKVTSLAITGQPAPVTAKEGNLVKFTVTAKGPGIAYQWQLSDDAGKTWRNSKGTEATYCTTLGTANNGRYLRCVVTDKYGNSVKSNAAYMKITSLKITGQPADATAKTGGTVTFKVTANGPGITYQWQLSDDAGKTWRNSSTTAATYTTTLSDKNNGRYVRCVVTDKYGNSVTSKAASMKVK